MEMAEIDPLTRNTMHYCVESICNVYLYTPDTQDVLGNGGYGIRTRERVATFLNYQSSAIDHSANPPDRISQRKLAFLF